MIPNSAATVAEGHLIVASHVDIIRIVLTKRAAEKQLVNAVDYKAVLRILFQLA